MILKKKNADSILGKAWIAFQKLNNMFNYTVLYIIYTCTGGIL